MKTIIDRIEEDYIILELEDLSHVAIPKKLIDNPKEGLVVEINVNYEESNIIKNEQQSILDELFKSN